MYKISAQLPKELVAQHMYPKFKATVKYLECDNYIDYLVVSD